VADGVLAVRAHPGYGSAICYEGIAVRDVKAYRPWAFTSYAAQFACSWRHERLSAALK
jgi:hypothetical protein